MNQSIKLVVFLVIAAVILGVGTWYANNLINATNNTQQAPTQQIEAQSQTSTQSQNQSSSTQPMDGLKITDITVGTGTEAMNGDTVSVLYSGTLDNGTVFDASSLHGNQPFTFTLGAGQVISGWDLGVVGMKVGGTRELVIPADLGYGAQGAGGVIPPNATLHFTIQLLGVSSTASSGSSGQ